MLTLSGATYALDTTSSATEDLADISNLTAIWSFCS